MADPANLVRRVAGDDWTVAPIRLTAGDVAFDLTGCNVWAEVYARDAPLPVAVLAEGAGLTVAADRTTGTVTDLWVAKAITGPIKPDDPRDATYPTRIVVSVTDSRGRTREWLTIPVRVGDRRTTLLPLA